ncbi:MAG TPA: hypothetical protein EYG78_05515 [Sulfurovum sp.]|nr:hypothetical protein [Sulfurovum sp.]
MTKQINWKYILLLIISFFVLGYVVFIQRYSNVQINKYQDIVVVKENKAIQKGWIPAILPESAYEITETHDLDANTILGSFFYKEVDEAGLMGHLTPVGDMNNTSQWGNFLFKVDTILNKVQYRNKPGI